jgi:predicted 2-oxoglutarate/Fe(II)-dependent dioxygenase YbiX
MIPYHPETLQYVVTYQRLLSTSTCRDLLNWAKPRPHSTNAHEGWAPAEAATGHDTNSITPHRTCHTTMLPEDHELGTRVQRAVQTIAESYPYQHQSHTHTGFMLVRYAEGHKFLEHVDHYSGAPRTLSISVRLNDDYEGGAFTVFNGTYRPELQPGDAVVMPSNLCFPHSVEPVTRGTRYSLVIWTV